MSHLDKCTKGEWVAEYDGDYETSILVRGEENFCLASVHGCNVEEINSAYLMAASKKMYEALDKSECAIRILLSKCGTLLSEIAVGEVDSLLNEISETMEHARGEK